MLIKRISWIDVARGIGIILVIHGHSLSADSYRHFIYAFHMPLFFFLSGLVFDYKKNLVSVTFIKSARGILIPYAIFAVISIFLWPLHIPNFELNPIFLREQFLGVLYGNSQTLDSNIALWFLPCLFISKVAFAYLSKKITKKHILWGILFISSILGYLAFLYIPDLTLPLGIESALTAIVFLGAGSIIRTDYYKNLENIKRNKVIQFLVISSMICLIAGALNFYLYGRQIDVRLNNLGNYFIFYAGAISGIIMTLGVSILINKNKILEYLGKNSLLLFAMHSIVLYFINQLAGLILGMKTVWKIRDIYLAPIYTVIASSVILAVYYQIKKFGILKLERK